MAIYTVLIGSQYPACDFQMTVTVLNKGKGMCGSFQQTFVEEERLRDESQDGCAGGYNYYL